MAKYREIPEVILVDAVQWRGDNITEMYDFTDQVCHTTDHDKLCIKKTHSYGTIYATSGDYVIKDAKGEFHIWDENAFRHSYERVKE